MQFENSTPAAYAERREAAQAVTNSDGVPPRPAPGGAAPFPPLGHPRIEATGYTAASSHPRPRAAAGARRRPRRPRFGLQSEGREVPAGGAGGRAAPGRWTAGPCCTRAGTSPPGSTRAAAAGPAGRGRRRPAGGCRPPGSRPSARTSRRPPGSAGRPPRQGGGTGPAERCAPPRRGGGCGRGGAGAEGGLGSDFPAPSDRRGGRATGWFYWRRIEKARERLPGPGVASPPRCHRDRNGPPATNTSPPPVQGQSASYNRTLKTSLFYRQSPKYSWTAENTKAAVVNVIPILLPEKEALPAGLGVRTVLEMVVYPTDAMITSTGSSSPLRAVTCIVTVSVRTRRDRTRRSWPPRNTPGR